MFWNCIIFKIKKLKRLIFLLITIVGLSSCKTIYSGVAFEQTPVPEKPNYAEPENWAVLPGAYPESLEALTGPFTKKEVDVFFVYPTLLTDKKNPMWNADINLASVRKDVLDKSVQFQASCFADAANIYVPYYRQSHYKIYVPPHDKQEEKSRMIAYGDVKRAFQFYLTHYNKGRPIIIASHSQGSIMTGMLLMEFFDGTELEKKLVAAYLPGIKIDASKFKSLKEMTSPTATGGVVSWNTYKRKNLPKRYEKWYKGGITTNPILWNDQRTAESNFHKGTLNADQKIYKNALAIECIDGMVWSTVPKIPKRFFLSFIKNYHFADINLFWEDIRVNAMQRSSAWLKKNKN